jgi:hypothetical protein
VVAPLRPGRWHSNCPTARGAIPVIRDHGTSDLVPPFADPHGTLLPAVQILHGLGQPPEGILDGGDGNEVTRGSAADARGRHAPPQGIRYRKTWPLTKTRARAAAERRTTSSGCACAPSSVNPGQRRTLEPAPSRSAGGRRDRLPPSQASFIRCRGFVLPPECPSSIQVGA